MAVLCVLLPVIQCEAYDMPDFEIRRQHFNKGDTLTVNDRGLTFIRIAPHLLTGRLTITAFPVSSLPVNITAGAGVGYAFGPIALKISYSTSALTPCLVTVWKISTGCAHAIFSRFSEEAIIQWNGERVMDQICDFFEFSQPPFLEVDYRDETQSPLRIIQMDAANGYSRADLERGMSSHLNSTFTIVAREYGPLDFRVRIWSDSSTVDWGDSDGEFRDCRDNPGNCTEGRFGDFGLTVLRRMAGGRIAMLIVVRVFTIAIGWWMSFWNAGPDISMGSGMKPLQTGLPLGPT
jgi:hypothetical protein